MKGIGGGLGVGTVVVGCLFGLGEGIVQLGDELGSNVGFGLGIGVLSNSLGLILSILNGVVNGTGVAISLKGRGFGGATTVGNHVGLKNGMGMVLHSLPNVSIRE